MQEKLIKSFKFTLIISRMIWLSCRIIKLKELKQLETLLIRSLMTPFRIFL